MDTETEAELTAELRRAWADRTVLLVTHRLLSLADADQILVIEDGRMIESGTHDQLVATDGLYARLYAEQAAEAQIDALDPEAAG